MKRLFTLLVLSAGVCSCSGVQYQGKENLINLFDVDNEAISSDSLAFKSSGAGDTSFIEKKKESNVKNLGGIVVNRFDKDGIAKEPMVFNIKKKKSRVYAETMLFESDNKDKSFFDEGSFDIGVDKKNTGVNISFTFKY